MNLLEQGITKGLIALEDDGKTIIYRHQGKRRNYQNPEEKVQAETFLKLVLEYGYPVNRVRQFEKVTIGSSVREADIIIYADDDCKKPFIVVECKEKEVSDAEFVQAIEQAFSYSGVYPTAKYVWVTSGLNNQYFEYLPQAPKERVKNRKTDIPRFGSDETPPYRYVKKPTDPRFKDLEVVSQDDLSRRFKQAHDALWAGGELNPSQAFDELDKLIFCKIWDEKKTPKDKPYRFQVYEGQPAKDLQDRVFAIYQEGRKEEPNVFSKDIDLTPERIVTVTGYLQDISLSETDLDSKGRAFEKFLGTYFRGEFGQYFTPRNVVEFVVNALPIKNTSKVLDTSCGSGGFLLYALDKVRHLADAAFDKNDPTEKLEHYKYWHSFAEKKLFGIEINEQISRVAKMNMIIHDDGHTNVVNFDGLYQIDHIREQTKNEGFRADSFDFIITNPPFGSIVKQSEKSYMQVDGSTAPYYNWALREVNWIDRIAKGKHTMTGRENQSTEILFIEQCHKFLAPGRYLAIVVPDGVLTNSSLQKYRDDIMQMFRIVAVVSLPGTAFTHTGAGVKSSVMFLRKHDAQTSATIRSTIEGLENGLGAELDLPGTLQKWEQSRKEALRQFPKVLDEAAEARRKAVQEEFAEQRNALYEEWEDRLNQRKQTATLPDYPVFMAIADKIGYDATGKEIPQNDLKDIGTELARFIEAIETGTDGFFG